MQSHAVRCDQAHTLSVGRPEDLFFHFNPFYTICQNNIPIGCNSYLSVCLACSFKVKCTGFQVKPGMTQIPSIRTRQHRLNLQFFSIRPDHHGTINICPVNIAGHRLVSFQNRFIRESEPVLPTCRYDRRIRVDPG